MRLTPADEPSTSAGATRPPETSGAAPNGVQLRPGISEALPMQAGAQVRLIHDPQRRGTLTGEQRDRGGRQYLQVHFPDRTDWVPEDQLELVEDGGSAAIDLLRRGRIGRPADLERTLAQIRLAGRLANMIYSLETTDTDFYAYQFKPVLKLLHSVNNGILIADEVGLGKTIEAGLIWTELRTRFDYQRLVVLCPAMLRDKWCGELRRRFGIDAVEKDADGTLTALRRVADGDRPDLAIVASMQGLRPPTGWADHHDGGGPRGELARLLRNRAEDEPLVDLLVVDEAHYMRNPETRTNELGRLMRGVSAFVVLLSATPVHLDSADLFHLLHLVDEDTFSRVDIFDDILRANEHLIHARDAVIRHRIGADELRERLQVAARHRLLRENQQLRRLIDVPPDRDDLADTTRRAALAHRLDSINLIGHCLTRTRKRDVTEWRVVRDPKAESVPMTELEREFYETVTATVREYCRENVAEEGFLLVMPQRQMSSCMAAALEAWSGEQVTVGEELYEDFGLEDQGDDGEEENLGPLIAELRRRSAELGDLRDLARHDSKYERLRDRLLAFFTTSRNEKVVLFSYFRQTLDYLRRRLAADKITSIVLQGGVDDKQAVLRAFETPDGPQVLLSSEVGSEGIDLQFCWVLINYDLPWNPMKVEQRIGRLDRIGQRSEKIGIWNMLHAETIDDRIYDRLYRRIGIFERTLGGLEPILGPKVQELTRDLLTHDLSPEQEAERIDQTVQALANVQQEEERLEGEAASLMAYGDYIVSQVNAARDLSRRVTSEDVQRHVVDFFGRYYPGCLFRQEAEDPSLFDVTLSAEAKNDLSRFLRERRSDGRTRLVRNDPRPLRVRFENKSRLSGGTGVESISQFHPMMRFISTEIQARRGLDFPAIAMQVPMSALPTEVAIQGGDYLFAVARFTIEALRITEHLWYGAELLSSPELVLTDDQAEQLVLAAARQGRDWLAVTGDVEPEGLATRIENGLLVTARARYDEFVEAHLVENEDRANLQAETMKTHLERQREKYGNTRAKHLADNNPGLAKATEDLIAKLEKRVERELLAIETRRQLKHAIDEVAVGVVRVMLD